MAENIVINNTTPTSSGSTGLSGLIRPITTLVIVFAFIALIYGLVLLVENWEAIGVFFTTGFIGWLNPFDSPEGDTGPVESVIGTSNAKVARTGVGLIPIIGPPLQSFLYAFSR